MVHGNGMTSNYSSRRIRWLSVEPRCECERLASGMDLRCEPFHAPDIARPLESFEKIVWDWNAVTRG